MTDPAALPLTDADRSMDPIRREILAGRPLIVLTARPLLGHVREALAVCGRTGDALTLHTGGRIFWPERLSRTCRRPDPRSLPDREPFRDRTWFHDQIGSRAKALAPLPPIGLGEATDANRVVTIIDKGNFRSFGTAYALWLLEESKARARAEGRPAPLLVLDQPDKRMQGASEEAMGRLWRRHYDGIGLPFAVWCIGEPDVPEMSWSAENVERIAANMRTFDASARRGGGDGFVHGEIDGRLVVVRDAYEGERRGAEMFEILPNGTCAGLLLHAFEKDIPDLDRILTLCLRAGFAHFSSRGRAWDARQITDPVEALLAEEGAWPRRRASVAHLVRDRLDLRLGHALRVLNGRESILRLLDAEAVAGPPVAARRDFVLTWPFLAQALLDPAVLEAVDRGEETIPLVAGVLGTSQAVVRRLVGHPAAPGGAYETGMDPLFLGQHLDAIGHDRLPARGDRKGWIALILMIQKMQQLAQIARMEPIPPETACALLLAVPGRGWSDRGEAIFGRRGGSSFQDIGDMVSLLAEWLNLLTGVDVTSDMAFGVVAGHGSLARIVDASARWHDDTRLTGGSGSLPHDCAWPVPFDAVDLGDGWSAVALADLPSLRAEGHEGEDGEGMAGLSHCVCRPRQGRARGPTCPSCPNPGAFGSRAALGDRSPRASTEACRQPGRS